MGDKVGKSGEYQVDIMTGQGIVQRISNSVQDTVFTILQAIFIINLD